MRAGLLFLVASLCQATTYYVSPQGSDSNNGLTANGAWLTVGHVNAHTFSPGDTTLFQRGATWKDAALAPVQSGSAGNVITFGAFGYGALPIIDNTAVESGFTLTSGNVWQLSVVFTPPTPRQVFFDGTRGTPQSSQGALATNNDWFYNSGTHILYIYSTTNPSGKLIEASVRENGLVINTKSYITAMNLAINRAGSHGIEISTGNHITLTGMNAALNGQDGISVEQGSSNVSVTGGTLANNGVISGGDNNGIGTGGLGTVSTPITITGVEIYGSGNENIEIYGPAGTTAITVTQCYLHGGSAGGIRLSGPGTVNATLTYNNIANTPGNGIIVGTAGVNALAYNNTITGNAQQGFYLFAAGTANVRNNILSQNGGNTGYEIERDAGTLTSDYNDVYHPANLTQQMYFQGSGGGQSFASWKTNTGQDAHSPGTDPLLNADFSLQAGSPAFSAGVVIGGVTTVAAPNIGSFLTQIPVSVTSTSPTQATMQIRGFSGACTIVVSASRGGPTIPDFDGTEYSGSSTDTGRADTITTADGLLRTVTIGHQTDDRALANNTPYYYSVSGCGTASGSFVTANLSTGTVRAEQSPFNASKYGNLGVPSIDWTTQINTLIDPLTGAKMQTMNTSSQTWRSGGGGSSLASQFETFADWSGGSGWTNPGNIINGSTSTASTNNTNPIYLYSDIPPTQFGSGPSAYNYNRVLEDIAAVMWAGCSGCTSAADKRVDLCISFDGSTCASNTIVVPSVAGAIAPVLSGSSDPDQPWPAAFPASPFFGWFGSTSAPLRLENQETFGTLNATGGALTISSPTAHLSPNYFSDLLGTGNVISIAGSGCSTAGSTDLCRYSSVTNAQTAATVESITASGAAYRSYGFSIRVWKETSTGTATIGVKYKIAGSFAPLQSIAGGDICSKIQDTSGDGLTGTLCQFTSNSVPILLGFVSTTGVTRMLSATTVNVGFSPSAGNTVLQGTRNGSNGWGVTQQVYGGDYTNNLLPNNYTCAAAGNCPTFSDGFVGTDLMPHGSNLDLDQQITSLQGVTLPAYDFSQYGHWVTTNSAVGFYGTAGCYAIFANVYSGQGQDHGGGPGWIATVNACLNPAVVTGLCHTLDGSGCAGVRGSLHNVQNTSRDSTIFISADQLYASNTALLYGGPWQAQVQDIQVSDAPVVWSGHAGGTTAGTCVEGSLGNGSCAVGYFTGCSPLIFTCTGWPKANGIVPYTQLMTVRFQDGGLCSTSASAAEIAAHPCPWAPGTAGHYPILAPGDNLYDDKLLNGTNSDGEHFRILEVVNGGSGCGASMTCYLVARNSVPVYCGRNLQTWQGLPNPDGVGNASQFSHANGWTMVMAPGAFDTCSGEAALQDVSSGVVQELGRIYDVHFQTGTGPSGNVNFVTQPASQYDVPFASLANVPIVNNATPDLVWQGSGGTILLQNAQSYTTDSQWNAGASGHHWAVDTNASVDCVADQLGCGPSRSVTNITGDIYKIGTNGSSSPSEATYKSQPMIGWAGRYLLKDVSGPASNVNTAWTICFVLVAGECHAGSVANEVYANIPHMYDPGFCSASITFSNTPCIWFGVNAPAGGIRQFRINQNDATGQYSRWISNGMASIGRQYPFCHSTIYPSGYWTMLMGCHPIDGFDSIGMLISMPPWVERQDPGNVYRTVPVKIPAGHATASVRFGYSTYSGPLASATTFQCTARLDACVAGTNLTPYAFASETFTETACTSGCTINVPAVAGKQMFLQAWSAGVAVGDPWAVSVP